MTLLRTQRGQMARGLPQAPGVGHVETRTTLTERALNGACSILCQERPLRLPDHPPFPNGRRLVFKRCTTPHGATAPTSTTRCKLLQFHYLRFLTQGVPFVNHPHDGRFKYSKNSNSGRQIHLAKTSVLGKINLELIWPGGGNCPGDVPALISLPATSHIGQVVCDASSGSLVTAGGVHDEACPILSVVAGYLALLPGTLHRRWLPVHARGWSAIQIRRRRWLEGR